MKAFIHSQFGYCPLIWMFHSRRLKNRINRIHDRSLCIVYRDAHNSFDELRCYIKLITLLPLNL